MTSLNVANNSSITSSIINTLKNTGIGSGSASAGGDITSTSIVNSGAISTATLDVSSTSAFHNTITTTDIIPTSLTASKLLLSDSSKKIVSSSVTSTEAEYLSGTTSSIQTQLNSKQATLSDIPATNCWCDKYSYYAWGSATTFLTVNTWTQMGTATITTSYIPNGVTSILTAYVPTTSFNYWKIIYSANSPRYYQVNMSVTLTDYGSLNPMGLRIYTSATQQAIGSMTTGRTTYGYSRFYPTATTSQIVDTNGADLYVSFGVFTSEGGGYVREYTLSIVPLGTTIFA